jgi:hypothetical protein
MSWQSELAGCCSGGFGDSSIGIGGGGSTEPTGNAAIPPANSAALHPQSFFQSVNDTNSSKISCNL